MWWWATPWAGGETDLAFRQAHTLTVISVGFGLLAAGIILAVGRPFLSFYDITPETEAIARQLIWACSINVVFLTISNMLTKGVLRGGGDTRFLMVADVVFLWCVSLPLGAMAGLVLDMSAFWVYTFLRGEAVLKSALALWRLYSKKWINVVK